MEKIKDTVLAWFYETLTRTNCENPASKNLQIPFELQPVLGVEGGILMRLPVKYLEFVFS